MTNALDYCEGMIFKSRMLRNVFVFYKEERINFIGISKSVKTLLFLDNKVRVGEK